METTQITEFGAAIFVTAVAAALREAEQQPQPLSARSFRELLNLHLNQFHDGTSPLQMHQTLSEADKVCLRNMQQLLGEFAKEDFLDLLIP